MSTDPAVEISPETSEKNSESNQGNQGPNEDDKSVENSKPGETGNSVQVATPVSTDIGTSPTAEGAVAADVSSSEPVVRRGRGRPKGAKNKNPKPKPPPKPKRPIGRPRKYTYALQTRFSKQSFAKIEPVTDKPPDDIFQDGS